MPHGGNVVERVELTRGAFKGTYHTDSRNMDLEANADLDDDTKAELERARGPNLKQLEL